MNVQPKNFGFDLVALLFKPQLLIYVQDILKENVSWYRTL